MPGVDAFFMWALSHAQPGYKYVTCSRRLRHPELVACLMASTGVNCCYFLHDSTILSPRFLVGAGPIQLMGFIFEHPAKIFSAYIPPHVNDVHLKSKAIHTHKQCSKGQKEES